MINNIELNRQVQILKQQHLELEARISEASEQKMDHLEIQRLKKKKLCVKDQIMKLQEDLNPDIIA